MARIRSIKPFAWHDERLSLCTRDARLLWTVLITMSDDEGRLRALPGVVFGKGYPNDLEALALIPGWLDELADAGLIVLYGDPVAGRPPYAAFPKWLDHQKIGKPTASKLPPPPGTPAGDSRDSQGSPGNPAPGGGVGVGGGVGAANAAAPRAGAHEPAVDEPHGGSGGASSSPTPMAWPQVRAALQHAGFDDQAIDADRDAIADLLADDERPIDWAAAGRQLRADRRRTGSKAPKLKARTPRPAVSYVLRQNWPPLLAGAQRTGPPALGLAPEPELAEAWPAVIDDARAQIGDGSWDSWLGVIRPMRLTDDGVEVVVPPHAETWIRERLAPLLAACCTRILQRELAVTVHAGQAVAA